MKRLLSLCIFGVVLLGYPVLQSTAQNPPPGKQPASTTKNRQSRATKTLGPIDSESRHRSIRTKAGHEFELLLKGGKLEYTWLGNGPIPRTEIIALTVARRRKAFDSFGQDPRKLIPGEVKPTACSLFHLESESPKQCKLDIARKLPVASMVWITTGAETAIFVADKNPVENAGGTTSFMPRIQARSNIIVLRGKKAFAPPRPNRTGRPRR